MASNKVPFIPRENAYQKALYELESYYQKSVLEVPLPIDVEELALNHFKLSQDMEDINAYFGLSSDSPVDGALVVETSQILIHSRLDPYLYPKMEGRYRFTIGHEIGHWVLHAPDRLPKSGQLSLSLETQNEPLYYCRELTGESEAATEDWIERQADWFSSELLMPSLRVNFEFTAYTQSFYPQIPISSPWKEEQVVNHLAKLFLVSPAAMTVKLKSLGFIQKPASPLFQ